MKAYNHLGTVLVIQRWRWTGLWQSPGFSCAWWEFTPFCDRQANGLFFFKWGWLVFSVTWNKWKKVCHSVVSNSLWFHGLYLVTFDQTLAVELKAIGAFIHAFKYRGGGLAHHWDTAALLPDSTLQALNLQGLPDKTKQKSPSESSRGLWEKSGPSATWDKD